VDIDIRGDRNKSGHDVQDALGDDEVVMAALVAAIHVFHFDN
jgi:hypothetical protein